MYDIVTRVPLIVWGPGRFGRGVHVEGLCQQMDIGPAILELAEAEVPAYIEAESLLPALEGKPWQERRWVFAEQGRDANFEATEFTTMVRSKDWKLVHFLDEDFGQLFDLAQDPQEVHNLWNDPTATVKKRELLDVLREWHIRSQYRTRELAAPWR